MAKTRGRTICDALKQVRQQIADANGIKYSPRECHHEGECRGTCPACEAEVRWLEQSLVGKYGNHFAQKVAGVAIVAGALTVTSCNFTNNNNTEQLIEHTATTGEAPTEGQDSTQQNMVRVAPPIILQDDPVPDEIIKVGEVAPEQKECMESEKPKSSAAMPEKNTIASNTNKERQPLPGVVEQAPSFVGGTAALIEYIKDNLQYPTECYDKGIQGRVIVGFTVTKEGKLKDVRIVKSVDPLLDKEALRIVKRMPDWIPGKLSGEPVDVKFNLPVIFRLL